MTQPMIAVGFSSIIGAILFFSAGFLLSRFRSVCVGPCISGRKQTRAVYAEQAGEMASINQHGGAFQEKEAKSSADIVRLKTELDEAQASNRQFKVQMESGSRELEAAKLTIASLNDRLLFQESELYQCKTRIEELTRSPEDDDQDLTRVQVEPERIRFEEQIRSLKNEIKELENDSVPADDHYEVIMQVEMLRQKEKKAQAILDEKAGLSSELSDAQKKIAELTEKLQDLEQETKDRQALMIRVEFLDEQLKKMEELRDSNARLEAMVAESAHMQEQVEALRIENTKFRSLGVVMDTPARPVFSDYAKGLGNSLQSLIERLMRDQSSRGVVLADEQGLLVAGSGDHADGLAAAAAMVDDVARKIRAILPLSTPQKITITDENSVTFVAQPFALSSVQLTLATLSVGPGPARQMVDRLITEASCLDEQNQPQ